MAGEIPSFKQAVESSPDYFYRPLRPREAADYLGTTLDSLAAMRRRGIGPRFHKPRGRVYYCRADLIEWTTGRKGPARGRPRKDAK